MNESHTLYIPLEILHTWVLATRDSTRVTSNSLFAKHKITEKVLYHTETDLNLSLFLLSHSRYLIAGKTLKV